MGVGDKDRHSRGPPGSSVNAALKKNGAGGKFTMGRPGDELGDVTVAKGDPNYDSDEEENWARQVSAGSETVEQNMPTHKIPKEPVLASPLAKFKAAEVALEMEIGKEFKLDEPVLQSPLANLSRAKVENDMMAEADAFMLDA